MPLDEKPSGHGPAPMGDTYAERKRTLREKIHDLEQRAAHPIPGALKEVGLEEQILALQNELRTVEQEERTVTPSSSQSQSATTENPKWEHEYLEYYDAPSAEVAPEASDLVIPKEELLPPPTPAVGEELIIPSEEVARHFAGTTIEPAAVGGAPAPATSPESPIVLPEEAFFRHLVDRGTELDTEAVRMGSEESSWIRSLGEQYNKIPTKYKIAVGLTLGLTAALATTPVTLLASVSALATQRVLGGLGMFVKFEDRLIETQSETSGMSKTERQAWAASQALVYGWIMSKTVATAVEVAGNVLHSDALHDWVLAHWPGHDAAVSHTAEVSPLATGMSLEHEMDMSTLPQMPDVSVHASEGHGYEFMVKRLWEQLQDKHLDPNQFAEHSDIHKLLTTDAAHIDTVVHQIASDPAHHFYNADGTSVLIHPDASMTIGADGQLHFSDISSADVVAAPEGAPTTPPYHPVAAPSAPEMPADNATPHTEIFMQPETGTTEAITNSHGFPVYESQSHVYASGSGERMYAYGGSATEKAALIRQFFADPANAERTIISSDANGNYQIPFTLVNNQIVAGSPLRSGGFLGFFSSFAKAVGTEDMGPIIK